MGLFTKFFLARIARNIANHQEGSMYLPIVQKWFPNGLAFRPREGRIVAIESGNHIHEFFMSMQGYCFLKDLLPKNFPWEHEEDRWWVCEIPETIEKARDVLRYINKFKRTDSPLVLTEENLKKMVKPITFDPVNLSGTRKEIWRDTGIYFFQKLSGELRMGNRQIKVKKYLGQGEIKTYDNLSPYLIASYYPYYFKILDQEDKNYIPTITENVVIAKVVNPYIAWVKSGDPFATFKTLVEKLSTKQVRTRSVHKVSSEINEDTDNTVSAISEIEEGILKGLRDPEKFFGFHFKSIEIVQVDVTGTHAEKIKTVASSIYIAKKDQEERTIKAEAKLFEQQKTADGEAYEIEKKGTATAKAIRDKAEADAYATIAKAEAKQKELAMVEPEKAKQLANLLAKIKKSGANPDLHLLKDVIGNIPEGSINITSISDLLNKLTSQNKN